MKLSRREYRIRMKKQSTILTAQKKEIKDFEAEISRIKLENKLLENARRAE